MRTKIEIDDQLAKAAMRHSGAHTKKAAVESWSALVGQTHSQVAIRELRGKVQWEGDLTKSRQARLQE